MTGVDGLVALQETPVQPLGLEQIQVMVASIAGKAGGLGFAVPGLQKLKLVYPVSVVVNALFAVPQTGAESRDAVQVVLAAHPAAPEQVQL